MTDNNIKEVINRTSIVDVINSTIPLKKKEIIILVLVHLKMKKHHHFR